MRIFGAGLLLLALLAGNIASAQQPVRPKREETQIAPPGVSPDMWAYIQDMRRQDDPKLNPQRAAQLKTQQRQARLASQQWYGVSNSRPTANPIPFMYQYSPSWVNNNVSPFLWSPGFNAASSVYVERNNYYR